MYFLGKLFRDFSVTNVTSYNDDRKLAPNY